MTVRSGRVRCDAFIFSSMSCRYTIDAQKADPFIINDCYVTTIEVNNRLIVDHPHEFYWQVTFDDRA